MRPVNLATRSFRNDRLAATGVGVALLALLLLTLWHGVAIRRLLPGRTSALHAEVAALERQVTALRTQARDLRREDPAKAVLARWTLVKDIVDQRAFSWTGLFERLEGLVPGGLRVTSIAPSVRRGQLHLLVTAEVRTPEDGWDFVRALEESGDFAEVFPLAEKEKEFEYVMRYRPRPRGPDGPAPAAAPRPGSSPAGATVSDASVGAGGER